METVPKRVAIIRANRYMVEHSDYLIAYAWHPASNAQDLVEYAQRREKQGRMKITLLSKLLKFALHSVAFCRFCQYNKITKLYQRRKRDG